MSSSDLTSGTRGDAPRTDPQGRPIETLTVTPAALEAIARNITWEREAFRAIYADEPRSEVELRFRKDEWRRRKEALAAAAIAAVTDLLPEDAAVLVAFEVRQRTDRWVRFAERLHALAKDHQGGPLRVDVTRFVDGLPRIIGLAE